jgi:hypothetical protein
VGAGVLAALALALAPSCSGNQPCRPIGPPPPSSFAPDALYLSPGSVRVTVPQPAVPGCELPPPERAVAAVYDPRNQTAPATLALASPGAHVGFDAGLPGWYHVAVTFEPNLGIGQLDVLAALDRRTTYVELPAHCDAVQRLSSGAFLCDDTLYRNGVSLTTQSASQRVVAGSAVWEALPSSGVQRREDTGSGDLVMTTAPYVPGSPSDAGTFTSWNAAVATEDELFALTPEGQLLHFGVVTDAGSSELRHLASAPVPSAMGLPRRLLAHPPTGSVWLALSATSTPRRVETSVCRMRPARGQPLGLPADAGCLQIRGEPIGASDDGFWIWPEEENILHFVHVDETGARSRASVAVPEDATVGQGLVLVDGPPQLTVFSARVMILPRFDGQEIVFDAFDPEKRSTFRGASSDLVWLNSLSGPPQRTLVFQRAR